MPAQRENRAPHMPRSSRDGGLASSFGTATARASKIQKKKSKSAPIFPGIKESDWFRYEPEYVEPPLSPRPYKSKLYVPSPEDMTGLLAPYAPTKLRADAELGETLEKVAREHPFPEEISSMLPTSRRSVRVAARDRKKETTAEIEKKNFIHRKRELTYTGSKTKDMPKVTKRGKAPKIITNTHTALRSKKTDKVTKDNEREESPSLFVPGSQSQEEEIGEPSKKLTGVTDNFSSGLVFRTKKNLKTGC